MAGQKISGVALGSVFAGSIFLYAGIKGVSIPAAVQNIVQGKSPAGAAKAAQITGTRASALAGTAGTTGIVTAGGSGPAIASDALKYEGAGYVWDGSPAQGAGHWDCSSFANWVIGHDSGLAIPGVTGSYDGTSHGPNTISWLAWSGCTTIGHDGAAAQAGDLAVWQTHMGICLGPDQMISAQNPASGTRVSAISGFIRGEVLFIRRLKAIAGG